MRASLFGKFIITGAVLLSITTSAYAAEYFVPYSPYAPGNDYLPPLNSPEARFQAQTDVYQSEINRYQRDRAHHETWNRENFEAHEMDERLFYNREY